MVGRATRTTKRVNMRNEIRRCCIPNTSTSEHTTYLIPSDAEVVADPSRALKLEAAHSVGHDEDVERLWATSRRQETLGRSNPLMIDPNCKLTSVTDLDSDILHRCTESLQPSDIFRMAKCLRFAAECGVGRPRPWTGVLVD